MFEFEWFINLIKWIILIKYYWNENCCEFVLLGMIYERYVMFFIMLCLLDVIYN